MRIPRDLSGSELIRRLGRLGYEKSRQTGSHIRLTFPADGRRSAHHLTVPNHDPLRIGTLAAILDAVATHHGIGRDQLLAKLFV
jgi:predicted RNA binding protein YcfA (HicA-like mRNA interferase family)